MAAWMVGRNPALDYERSAMLAIAPRSADRLFERRRVRWIASGFRQDAGAPRERLAGVSADWQHDAPEPIPQG
jgi:hypothetical protein